MLRSFVKLVLKNMYSVNERSYCTVERGCPYSTDYRIYFTTKSGKYVSPWHDIPLHVNKEKHTYNMICEIPRWTNAKLEISTKDPLNPIKHDIKNGKVRFVDNCFPHHGYIWNYGAFPQTWEDPHNVDADTKCKGDNDPIDVIEIGQKLAKRGEVIEVKVLGTLALIDEGETDWKIVAIDVTDPLANQLNGIRDVEKILPGLLAATNEWFRIYKIPAGKPENQFAFNGQYKDKDYALSIIAETHEFWRKLVQQIDTHGLSCKGVEAKECSEKLDEKQCKSLVMATPECGPAKPIPPETHKWHYISG